MWGGIRAVAIMSGEGLHGSRHSQEEHENHKCQASHEIYFGANAAGVTRPIARVGALPRCLKLFGEVGPERTARTCDHLCCNRGFNMGAA
jgi:hypothetical protein